MEVIDGNAHGDLQLWVRLEGGRVVEDAYAAFVRDGIPRRRRVPALPRISPAYAGTAYAVQGRTASACVYVGMTANDARELYVGLTRHRLEAWLVVERERLEVAVRARSSDPRAVPSTAELHERLFVEARRYTEKANVVDHVENRATFVRTRLIPPSIAEIGLNLRRRFEAARALRSVLREIGAASRLALWHLIGQVRCIERGPARRLAGIIEALRGPQSEQAAAQTPSRSGLEYDR